MIESSTDRTIFSQGLQYSQNHFLVLLQIALYNNAKDQTTKSTFPLKQTALQYRGWKVEESWQHEMAVSFPDASAGGCKVFSAGFTERDPLVLTTPCLA